MWFHRSEKGGVNIVLRLTAEINSALRNVISKQINVASRVSLRRRTLFAAASRLTGGEWRHF